MIRLPNLIIVSGTGQNVGKTTFVQSVINKFSSQNITAIKISPHKHEQCESAKIINMCR